MGIPFYFGEIIAKSPVSKRFNIVADNLPKKCSRFFLDFNSIIHPCSAQVVAKLNQQVAVDDKLYEAIFNNIASYTLKLIDITQPTEMLYIAIDGVAPRAKMHQQRKRRFLSAQRNKAISVFKAKHIISDTKWDSNCITPGTEFMLKLDKYLTTTFQETVKSKYPNLKEFIVSGSDEVGEGEHKMIHYIKKNSSLACDVIYGLDADLIMLSLTAFHANIVLMRESQDFGQHQSSNRQPFKYLNISSLREGVYDTLVPYSQNQTTTDETEMNMALINDYVFMCYFLGNDFIPSLSFLKIKDGAVDVLIECYKEACSQETLIAYDANAAEEDRKYSINLGAFTSFVCALKKREDEMMSYVVEHYNTVLPRPQKNFNTIMQNIKNYNPQLTNKEVQERAVRDFSMDLEEYPLRNKYIVDINPSIDKKWRNTYYHYIFSSNSIETIKGACKKYVEGLLWTTNYYFDLSASHEWYYHYDYAPCASDLHKYLMALEIDAFSIMKEELKFSMDKMEKEKEQYNLQHLQLLLVLPPQSQSLLPSKLQDIMTQIDYGCLHYYPNDFRVMTFLKHKMWECNPRIPNIDVELIKDNLRTLEIES
jgi:5'-3' exoribonuclease 1